MTCGTAHSEASPVVTLQLLPIQFPQGEQRQPHGRGVVQLQGCLLGAAVVLGGHLPHSRGGLPGTELLGGLAEVISVVQHEPHPGLLPELPAVDLQACDPAAGLGVPENKLGPHCIKGLPAAAARHLGSPPWGLAPTGPHHRRTQTCAALHWAAGSLIVPL